MLYKKYNTYNILYISYQMIVPATICRMFQKWGFSYDRALLVDADPKTLRSKTAMRIIQSFLSGFLTLALSFPAVALAAETPAPASATPVSENRTDTATAAPASAAAKPAAHPKTTLAVGAALDDNGRLWLAKAVGKQLFVSHSDDGGNNLSEPVLVTPEPEEIAVDGENRPKIAVARDGTVMLSWAQILPQKMRAANVRFSRSTDAGVSFSRPVTVNDDHRITSHRFNSMAADGAGRVVLAWLDARDRDSAKEAGGEFTGVSVYSAQSKDNGATFTPNHLSQSHTCECCRTAMTFSKEGPVVMWRDIFHVNTRDFVIAHMDTGKVRRATDDEWEVNACPHNGGGIAADAGLNRLHLVWFTNGKTRQGIFYKYIDGHRESVSMQIGNAAAQANYPSVAVRGQKVFITWREFDGNTYTAHIMHSADGGISWSAPEAIMHSASATDFPLVITNSQQAVLVWNTTSEGLQIRNIEPDYKKTAAR